MEAIRVDAVLLRGLLPDLRLAAGTTLAARVLERTERHGLLSLAGAAVVAELPDDVPAGARLRLVVQEVSGERVVLRVVPDAPPPPAAALAAALPLPHGAHARVTVAERDAEALAGAPGAGAAVALHYDSPTLGRIELRLALTGGRVVAGVGASGEAHARAGAAAGELREALSRALGRPADVQVGVRRDRVDLRA